MTRMPLAPISPGHVHVRDQQRAAQVIPLRDKYDISSIENGGLQFNLAHTHLFRKLMPTRLLDETYTRSQDLAVSKKKALPDCKRGAVVRSASIVHSPRRAVSRTRTIAVPHGILCRRCLQCGDIATHIQRILIQPRNVSCGRRFGPDITVEDLLSVPTFEKCHPRMQTVLCKKCATIVSWGLACDQSVLQNNAREYLCIPRVRLWSIRPRSSGRCVLLRGGMVRNASNCAYQPQCQHAACKEQAPGVRAVKRRFAILSSGNGRG
jgi:hypothetical protein